MNRLKANDKDTNNQGVAQVMEAYGRTLTRQPNEFERVQRGSSSPLGTQSPEKMPFQVTSTEKKKKKENKLTHATQNAMIGTLINPNR